MLLDIPSSKWSDINTCIEDLTQVVILYEIHGQAIGDFHESI